MDFSLNDKQTLQERIKSLEEIELRDQDETGEEVYKNLLVSYMLDDQPMKAKFLWKRIPKSLRTENQSSELNRIWSIIQYLIQRKYVQAFDLVAQYKRSNQQWSSVELSNLLNKMIETSKERLFDLVNVAYSSINVQELANLLGLSKDEAINIALSQQWTLDETHTFLLPEKKQTKEIAEIPNQIQMQQLTSIVSFLET